MLRSFVQFCYTTIFGWFEAYVFIRTGSLLGTIAAHSFCNYLGLPRLWGRVGVNMGEEILDEVTSPEKIKGEYEKYEDSPDGPVSRLVRRRKSLGIQWTVAYYSLLFAGAYGFYKNLGPFTDSPNRIANF